MTCSSSVARMAARLASSGSTSSRPRLRTIVWPIVNDSSVQVVGDFEVVDHRLQHLVNFARGGQQSKPLHALGHVLFSMAVPAALYLDWRKVMRTGGPIVYQRGRLHENFTELLLFMGLAEVIAPQARLCLERELLGGGLVQVAMIAIDEGWQPLIL